MLLFRAIANVSLFTFSVLISPPLIVLYLLCWTWAKLVTVFYGFQKFILLTGNDVLISTESHSVTTIINALLLTQDHFSVEAIKERVVDKVINATDGRNRPLFPRFTSCLISRAGYLMWSEASNFNIDEHIGWYQGPSPHNEAELKTLVNDLCNRRLPESRPGWQFTAIPLRYTQTSDNASVPKTCVLIRIHHSIADGISLSRILFEILGSQVGPTDQVQRQMDKKVKTKFRKGLMRKLEMLFRIAQAMFLAPGVLWKLQFNNDPHLLRKSELSGKLIYDWSSPIKLSIIKDIKNATATTVNDVITSCLTGALRKVLLKHGACPPLIRSLIMINLHSPGEPVEATNKSIFIHTPLATGDMGCMQRLTTTKANMENMKRSPDIMVNRWFNQYVCGTVPLKAVKWFFELTHQTVVLSNVRGPSNKLYFISQIDAVVALPQIRVIHDFGVLVHSYRDEVTVSVTAHTAIVDHKDIVGLLLKEFVEEIQQLHSSINV